MLVFPTELQSEYKDSYIRVGDQAFIRTFTMEAEQEPPAEKLPLVMMHGFGCGLGAFYRNYDGLHSERKLLSLDVLGFGRSSRVSFIADADRAEGEFVDSIENWRQSVGLDKFILLGHSFGAFLACSYAMKFPTRCQLALHECQTPCQQCLSLVQGPSPNYGGSLGILYQTPSSWVYLAADVSCNWCLCVEI